MANFFYLLLELIDLLACLWIICHLALIVEISAHSQLQSSSIDKWWWRLWHIICWCIWAGGGAAAGWDLFSLPQALLMACHTASSTSCSRSSFWSFVRYFLAHLARLMKINLYSSSTSSTSFLTSFSIRLYIFSFISSHFLAAGVILLLLAESAREMGLVGGTGCVGAFEVEAIAAKSLGCLAISTASKSSGGVTMPCSPAVPLLFSVGSSDSG